MAPKKKPRPDAAQQLIDSLLDDNSVSTTDSRDSYEAVELNSNSTSTSSPPKHEGPGKFEMDSNSGQSDVGLSLEGLSKSMKLDPIALANLRARESQENAAPFDGTTPLVTQMANDLQRLSLNELPPPPPLPKTAGDGNNERTVRIVSSTASREVDRFSPTEVRPMPGSEKPRAVQTPYHSTSAVSSSSEAVLKQSENLRIAQARITELEQELDRFRRDNEQLAAAGETLRRRTDELLTRMENLDSQASESRKIAEEEHKVFRGQMQAKERENLELRGRLEEMEGRLESNFKKIRVRERELEHRLEIVKMESTTLVSAKDKMILELKRHVDQLGHENEFGKQKTQELFNQYKEKQETIRRVVRALRIALTVLEGDEDNTAPLKKAE